MSIKLTGLNRDLTDKFYTKTTIANECVMLFKKNIKYNSNDIIIEPSAGNGSFIPFIKKLGIISKFYDILPEHPEIEKQDFLGLNIDYIGKNIHIIGNPPFGRQSSLAIKFVKKCCEFASSISFILPKSFKKDSLQKHFKLNYHLVHEWDIPENSFVINDKQSNVPCVFQIWEYKQQYRNELEKEMPNGYIFVKKSETPDIAFRRVGVNAGKISVNILDKNEQTHYFIKFINNRNLDLNLNYLKKLSFEHNNTVGPKSISKQQIIKEFNRLLNRSI
jgi:hypothetical protein